MPLTTWFGTYQDKMASAREALAHIQNGQTIFLGSGAGEPTFMVVESCTLGLDPR